MGLFARQFRESDSGRCKPQWTTTNRTIRVVYLLQYLKFAFASLNIVPVSLPLCHDQKIGDAPESDDVRDKEFVCILKNVRAPVVLRVISVLRCSKKSGHFF